MSASVGVFSLRSVPPVVLTDCPLELEFAGASDPLPDDLVSASTARYLSTHARLSLSFETPGANLTPCSVPVAVRASSGGWRARLLIRPVSWTDAASITVSSLELSGRPLPCACLPATLRVGYNHTPARAGAVLNAARTGNILALQAALDAGGSTEESDHVREEVSDQYLRCFTCDQDPAALSRLQSESLHGGLHCFLLWSPRRPPRAAGGRRRPGRTQRGKREMP